MRVQSAMLLAVMLTGFGLLSCSEEGEPEKLEGVIPAHQLKALEKANDVEELLKEADKARRTTTDE